MPQQRSHAKAARRNPKIPELHKAPAQLSHLRKRPARPEGRLGKYRISLLLHRGMGHTPAFAGVWIKTKAPVSSRWTLITCECSSGPAFKHLNRAKSTRALQCWDTVCCWGPCTLMWKEGCQHQQGEGKKAVLFQRVWNKKKKRQIYIWGSEILLGQRLKL